MGRSKDSKTIIPERIKAVLRERGMTQVQLCEKIRENKDVFNRCLRKAEMPKSILSETAYTLNISPGYLTGETDNRSETYSDYFQQNHDYESFSKYVDEQEQMKMLTLRYLSSRTYRIPGTTKQKIIDFENLSWDQADELLSRIQKTAWIYAIENDLFGEKEGE